MQSKFHLTEAGPKTCTASVRDCPIGGAHFETQDAAERAFEFKSDKKFNPLGALKKKVNPFTKHTSVAEKRIRELEPEMLLRDARQENATLYHELLADGFTAEELEERFKDETNNRESTISYTENQEGEARAVGLTYGGDYKAEEEYGMAAITKGLAEGTYGRDDVLLYNRGGATILVIRGERTYGQSIDPRQNDSVRRAEAQAHGRYNNYLPHEHMRLKWRLEDTPVADLRAELKGKVVPLPKTKAALVEEVLKLRIPPYRKPAVGEFQTGSALVMVTKDPLEAELMTRLKDSHNNGSLRVGNSANPFSRSALFYDDRDLSRATKSKMIRQEEVTKAAEAYISETKGNLEANGSVYSIMPNAGEGMTDIRGTKYFLNYSPKGSKQLHGWFDKDQLDRIAQGDYSDVKA